MNENKCWVDGTVYVAQVSAEDCSGCAALPDDELCNHLGCCAKYGRTDGNEVVWLVKQVNPEPLVLSG